ncbi:PREDICTED: uncharacterized protein LOC107880918 [Prunus mume]|uniref:Uncharacterized protein LOC107880918 n=1 Tax=Prunus mume TaxID=102107 RepID=A0ABM1LNH4_PRUMU|nr:PREDICTED: uncharacterized protein LOC107880918 [Prunus mume]
MVCDSKFSTWVRDQAAFAVLGLVKFNKNVFVGLVLMGPIVRALIQMGSSCSIQVLTGLVKIIRTPLVDDVNGEIVRRITKTYCLLGTQNLSRLGKPQTVFNKDNEGLRVPSSTRSVNHNSIRTLTGSNYKKWREDVEIALGLLDYEMVLTDEALSVPAIDASAETKTKYAKWIKANKMAILIMRRSISEEVRGSIIETESAKLFMEAIAENFQGSKKAEIGSLMSQLTDMKYNGEGCIRTHILNMVEIGNKLKALKVHVDETMMEEQSIRKDKGKEQVYLVQDTKFKPKEWTKKQEHR